MPHMINDQYSLVGKYGEVLGPRSWLHKVVLPVCKWTLGYKESLFMMWSLYLRDMFNSRELDTELA